MDLLYGGGGGRVVVVVVLVRVDTLTHTDSWLRV